MYFFFLPPRSRVGTYIRSISSQRLGVFYVIINSSRRTPFLSTGSERLLLDRPAAALHVIHGEPFVSAATRA